jgi:hypothetical protein
MSFNDAGQYTPNHKTWDHQGNIMPNVEHSEGERPSCEFKPAEWLPLKFFDKYFEDWSVVTPGKVVALDNDGRVVPAQYNLAGTLIVYTADDVAQGVTDVRTGLAVTAAASFAVSTVDGTPGFMGRTGEAMAVSKPIGVAPYVYKQWCGGDGVNPSQLRRHNYNMQHLVAVLCDYVLTLPLLAGTISAEVVTWLAPVANIVTNVGDPLASLPVAANTVRTPIVFTGADAGLFVTQVSSAAAVTSSGKWYIDLRTGLITVYKATAGAPVASVAYYSYASAPASVSVFAAAAGNLKPGDFVKYDANSNYVLDSAPSLDSTVGQVLEVVEFPRGGLEKVKTAYTPALNLSAAGSFPGYSGQMDQLPGSATGGVTDAIHFSGAANKMVRINLISR